MVYFDLTMNLALLVALTLVSGLLEKRWPHGTLFGALLQGLVFGGAAVLGMMKPVQFGPGIMFDALADALAALLAQRKRECLKAGRGEPVPVVFNKKGRHIEQNDIRRVFKRVLAKAGMREMRIHDTRHTFASLLLSGGVSPVYVKEQLGHSSIKMTVDTYGHLIPSSNRDAVNGLDNPQQSATHTQPAKIKGL